MGDVWVWYEVGLDQDWAAFLCVFALKIHFSENSHCLHDLVCSVPFCLSNAFTVSIYIINSHIGDMPDGY